MVYIVICQKCGEAFEADTASTESICPRCIMDQDIESSIYEHLLIDYLMGSQISAPNCGLTNKIENGKWK
jgi:hypothetical protein